MKADNWAGESIPDAYRFVKERYTPANIERIAQTNPTVAFGWSALRRRRWIRHCRTRSTRLPPWNRKRSRRFSTTFQTNPPSSPN